MLERFRQRLERLLGKRYAATVDLVDRGVTAFLLAFGAKLVAGDVFEVSSIANLSLWKAAAFAGTAALLSVAKSAVMVKTTGSPALLSVSSSTLRARRDSGRRVSHPIPVRPPRPTRPLPFPHDDAGAEA